MRYYIAYGSNMNIKQMKRRCPDAEIIGTGTIDYELKFYRGGYCDIIPSDKKKTPVVIWTISQADEQELDCYEGYPRFYTKEEGVPIAMDNGQTIYGMAYIMTEGYKYPQMPRADYFMTVLEGYLDNNIGTKPLSDALEVTRTEVKKWKNANLAGR